MKLNGISVRPATVLYAWLVAFSLVMAGCATADARDTSKFNTTELQRLVDEAHAKYKGLLSCCGRRPVMSNQEPRGIKGSASNGIGTFGLPLRNQKCGTGLKQAGTGSKTGAPHKIMV